MLLLNDPSNIYSSYRKYAPHQVMILPLDLTSGEDVLRKAVREAESFFDGDGVDYMFHNAAYEHPSDFLKQKRKRHLEATKQISKERERLLEATKQISTERFLEATRQKSIEQHLKATNQISTERHLKAVEHKST
ncbi:hypothetical protein POM88_040212 [Heracleum sosnowskyi]|uniref:Uncharacterized protein n=1 Tax=Heracleum sosnowskyi TaxID=360622 RepID=A0AAD8M8I8_9APIA|nr:hypothetical protein POM88_040212 [Heracleum sosnowskyi]